METKIIQITAVAADGIVLYALCEDGSVWTRLAGYTGQKDAEWQRLDPKSGTPAAPKDEPVPKPWSSMARHPEDIERLERIAESRCTEFVYNRTTKTWRWCRESKPHGGFKTRLEALHDAVYSDLDAP